MSISLISFFSFIYFIVIVTFSAAGKVQLSPQVSECLSLDLGLFSFISHSLIRHRHGEFSQVYGPELESCCGAYIFGGRFHSVFNYEVNSSPLHGQLLLVVSPSAKDTTFISFLGELF